MHACRSTLEDPTIQEGTTAERIALALRAAAHAGRLLEEAFPGELTFSRTDFELIVNDRALAPNSADTYAAALPVITAALTALLGHGDLKFTRHDREPRQRFGVTVHSARPFDLAPVPA